MATAYTSLLGLALPVTGELQGTWGNTVNDSITSLLDTAVAGTTTLSTDSNVTLSTTTGAANQARQAILLCTGSRSAQRTITAPAQSKIYTVINSTTGGFSVKLVGVGPTAGVTVVPGEAVVVAWNGSDFVKVSTFGGAGFFTDLTVSGNSQLGDAAGDTTTVSGPMTLSAGTANGVVYLNGSKVATSGTDLVFNATGLGIGTSSPGERLNVVGGGATSSTLNVTGGAAANDNATIASDYSLVFQVDANNSIGGRDFNWRYGGKGYSDGTSLMVLNSSGNLGLGVTPSAWATLKPLEIGYIGNAFSGYINDVGIYATSNAYYNGGWKYAASSKLATRYSAEAGVHSWATAPSGTAGNTISFTQAMTLDASANLTITPGTGAGLAATQTGLNVFGGASAGAATTPGILTLGVNSQTITSGETLGRIQFYSNDASGSSTGVVGKIDCIATTTFVGDCETALTFHTNDGAAGTIAERARITSGGDLLVGTTSSTTNIRLKVAGGGIDVAQPTSLSTGSNTIADNGSSPNTLRLYNSTDSNNTTNRFLICDAAASVLRAEIRSNGGLANYSANDVNLSDRREKTNFAPAKSYLDTICAIPVQTFNYVDQNLEDDPGLTLGVVAQDVQAVAPELVMESNWGTVDNPKMRLSIYQTDLQYALMKCIQEQQALITDLRARVAALEAQP